VCGLLQREHSLFGTVMSALSLARSSVVAADSFAYSPASAMLAVDSAGAGASGKLSPTSSLQCPRAVKAPVHQNSISVRDLFPAAYARSSAVKTDPAANDSAPNHVTRPGALPTPQIVCNSPSHYSPVSSSDRSSPAASPDRCASPTSLCNQPPSSRLRQPHSSPSVSDFPAHAPAASSYSLNLPLSPSITPSLFHFRLKTYLFHKFFPP